MTQPVTKTITVTSHVEHLQHVTCPWSGFAALPFRLMLILGEWKDLDIEIPNSLDINRPGLHLFC